jgi:His/Glu/Gln/Arg/opine family amino acid ABC transporter permease subunit
VLATVLENLTFLWGQLPNFLLGAGVTLRLAAVSGALGLVFGSLLGILRLSPFPPLQMVTRAYVDFFRGTPLLVQIFMIYFGLPPLVSSVGIQFTFNQWTAGVIALSLNSAAYIAEIVRAGIQSIDFGQREASQSLGLGPVETMRYVIFPQAFRRIIPPLGNEFISLLKDTSLVAVIGFEELFRKGQLVVASSFRSFQVYAAIAIIYLVMTLIASLLLSRLEQWMNPVERSKRVVAPQPTPVE